VRARLTEFHSFKLNFRSLVVLHASLAQVIVLEVGGIKALSDNGCAKATITSVTTVNKGKLFWFSRGTGGSLGYIW
jgi:hypothetical protein